MRDKVNLKEALALFSDYFAPRVIGQFNHHDIMVVKLKGEFIWHKHDDTDDFFYVLSGRLVIHLRHGEIVLNPGDLYVVPRGMEHMPVAENEAHVLLIEVRGTPNTGDTSTAARRREIKGGREL
jgi:mannose-6-phosphate isomerase-like protein (cupin superfamily)